MGLFFSLHYIVKMYAQILTGLCTLACVLVASQAFFLPPPILPPIGPIGPFRPPILPPPIGGFVPCPFGTVRVPSFRGFTCRPSIAYGGAGLGAGMAGGYGGGYGYGGGMMRDNDMMDMRDMRDPRGM